ncbi:hypothetical protein B0H12DRAFT_155552 [Mycena haematopus]|nr:hypothetical protein B0H12DRAFT_155552 [Mycena haematopus]
MSSVVGPYSCLEKSRHCTAPHDTNHGGVWSNNYINALMMPPSCSTKTVWHSSLPTSTIWVSRPMVNFIEEVLAGMVVSRWWTDAELASYAAVARWTHVELGIPFPPLPEALPGHRGASWTLSGGFAYELTNYALVMEAGVWAIQDLIPVDYSGRNNIGVH